MLPCDLVFENQTGFQKKVSCLMDDVNGTRMIFDKGDRLIMTYCPGRYYKIINIPQGPFRRNKDEESSHCIFAFKDTKKNVTVSCSYD